jgi:4a-hydroxytetrahydrobiopterin dehydratase
MNNLTETEIEEAVAELPGWTRDGEALVSDWRFANFDVAFGFMTRIAVEAERLDHHPEWSNVYNRVTIRLTTHEAGGITKMDTALAQFVSDTAAVMETLH